MPNRKPATIITGNINAQNPSMKANAISRGDLRGGLAMFSRRATHHHAKQSPTPSIRPGTIPARKSLEMETPPATPNSTKPMLGGITGAMMPPAATRPAAYILLWPAATIMGTSSAARAAASAAAEPDNEASAQEARMVTYPSPPGT